MNKTKFDLTHFQNNEIKV